MKDSATFDDTWAGVHLVRGEDTQRRSNQFARALDAAGLPQWARIAVLSRNLPEFWWTYRGATWSGRSVIPLSTTWHPNDIGYVLADSGAEALILDADCAARLPDELPPLSVRLAFGGPVAGFDDWWAAVAACSPDPYVSDIAGGAIPYTSGTTGTPRGVVAASASGPPPPFSAVRGAAMLGNSPYATTGPHLVCTPLYHSAPLFYCDGATQLGVDVVLLERFDAETFLRVVAEHRIASTFMVPTQFVRLLALPESVRTAHDLSSLKLIAHGAAPVAPAVKRRMIEWMGPHLHEFYGGSEGVGSTAITSEEWLTKPGSVGRASPGYRLRILDAAGNDLPPHTEGEVWFEGGRAFEYHGDPEKTRQARRGDDLSTLGDIGYLDEDGYLFLLDRRTDVVISGGVNVYPAHVEAVLQEHPAVRDVCVVGVPDEEWGSRVTAVIELSPEHTASDELAADLSRWADSRLARHEVPRSLRFHPGLPRTDTGKLSRHLVRSQLLTQETP